MMTKAMPEWDGMAPKNSFNDSRPPAEAPKPTTIKSGSESGNCFPWNLTLSTAAEVSQPSLLGLGKWISNLVPRPGWL